jgi:hypothetical protein
MSIMLILSKRSYKSHVIDPERPSHVLCGKQVRAGDWWSRPYEALDVVNLVSCNVCLAAYRKRTRSNRRDMR